MKKHLTKCFLSLALAAGLMSIGSITQTYAASYGHGSNYVCRWVPGHWRHGHWVPAKKVCWWRGGWKGGYSRCRMIPGHWYHGYWVPPRKVCR